MKKRKFESKNDLAIRPEAIGLLWPIAPMSSEVTDNGICVLKICGPLEHKYAGYFDSYESILERFEGALCDDDVKGIILDIDSPGGEVNGLQETVRKMVALKRQYGKPVCTYVDEECYSAAYALACAADDIYLPESGGCGSVGVLATLCDRTQATRDAGLRIEVIRSGTRKAEGHPDIPLSDSVIGRVQKRVDQLAKQFFKLVNKTRGVSMKDLKSLQGATVFGQKAVDVGLATAVMNFDQTVALLEEFLDISPVSNQIEGSEGSEMDIAQLKKRVEKALKAVENAKTPEARKSAASALASAQALLTEAKIKKSYKKRTVEEESEEDDGEAEAEDSEEEDEERAEDEEAPPSSKNPGKDDDDDDDDDEDDEDSKKMKKSKKASASDVITSFFGQSSESKARKLLESMAQTAARAEAAERKANALEAKANAAELERLIGEAVAAGQLKPAQMDWARTQSHASLTAYLKSTPPMYSPREKPAIQTQEIVSEEKDKDGLTASERKICEITGVSAKSYLENKAAGLKKFGSYNEGGN